jgi:hypothetical protein
MVALLFLITPDHTINALSVVVNTINIIIGQTFIIVRRRSMTDRLLKLPHFSVETENTINRL